MKLPNTNTPTRLRNPGIVLLLLGVLGAARPLQEPAPESVPELRAIQYLSQEVPRWRPRNGCFSCHNNGDGARALYAARRLRYAVPDAVLESTSEWLSQPLRWDDNRGEPRFSDKRLARIQFAASLLEATEAGLIGNPRVLLEAAQSLLQYQGADGSWPIDGGEQAGSPVTYGVPLATYMALRTLEAAGPEAFGKEIERARQWLLALDPKSIPDIAALLFSLTGNPSPGNRGRYRETLSKVIDSQKTDGGWGPYRFSPAETFDTALALLALSQIPEPDPGQLAAIRRGRRYLEAAQLDSGGWIETTRPSGFDSYAQHVSTSAWATLALIETRRFSPP